MNDFQHQSASLDDARRPVFSTHGAKGATQFRIRHDQTIVVDDLYRITMRMPHRGSSHGGKGRRCVLLIERLEEGNGVDVRVVRGVMG